MLSDFFEKYGMNECALKARAELEPFKEGSRVLVFDPRCKFYKPATVKRVYVYTSTLHEGKDVVADVHFDHRGLSKAHYITGLRLLKGTSDA